MMTYYARFLLITMFSFSKSQTSEVPLASDIHPRLEGPNYAGREFVFTFGDNRPTPSPVLFIAAYNAERVVRCTITYYLGEERDKLEIEVTGEGRLIDAPNKLVIRMNSGSIPLLIDMRSVHLKADAEVIVYGFSNAIYSTDAFLALPTDVLGLDYVIPSSEHTFTDIKVTCMIIVTGVCADIATNVTFRFPGVTGFYHPRTKEWQKSAELMLSVQQHETILLLADADLTGSLVTSDCEVAVMSGNKKGSIAGITGDHMYEMIPPISRLGRTYITTPIINRASGDVYALIGARDNTTCEISRLGSSDEQLFIELQAGQKHMMDIESNQYTLIECSTSAMLAQYSKSGMNSTSEADDIRYGDPFMSLVPALIQFDSVYTISCLQPVRVIKTPFDHYISILIEDEHMSKLKIDGQHLLNDSYISRNDSSNITVLKAYSIPAILYTHIVLMVKYGVHRLEHDNPTVTFGVMVYGLKASESYGYPGGMRLTLSGPDCIPMNTGVNDNTNNDCDWLVDEELYDGIDNDGDGRIDEDLAANKLYPMLDTLKQVSLSYNQEVNEFQKTQEDDSDMSGGVGLPIILITAILVALGAMLIVLTVVFYLRKTAPLVKGYSPAEFRNRFSQQRMSIRSVWTGRRSRTALDGDSTRDSSFDKQSNV